MTISILDAVVGQRIEATGDAPSSPYYAQCTDLVDYYWQKLYGSTLYGYGVDMATSAANAGKGWTLISNPSLSQLRQGAILSWGGYGVRVAAESGWITDVNNSYGHTGIFDSSNGNMFTFYQQNAPAGTGVVKSTLTWAGVTTAAIPPMVVPNTTNGVYRLFNPVSNQHIWSSSQGEAQALCNSGWLYQGVNWISPSSGAAVHRLYNPTTTEHLITTSSSEISGLVNSGWRDEGTSFYAGTSSSSTTPVAVTRLRNGYHMWSVDPNEISVLMASGWTNEGTSFYAQSK